MGIMPEELDAHDVIMSLKERDKGHEPDDIEPERGIHNLSNMLVFNKYKSAYICEHFLFVMLCLITPYIYGWFVVFG